MKLLSVQEAAEQLNVTTGTVYLWCKQNKIKHIRFGKTIRISPENLTPTENKKVLNGVA